MKNGQGCTACSPGTFASSDGVCELCPENSFSSNSSSFRCRPCPQGQWTAFSLGQTSCQKCNDSQCAILGQQEHGLRGTCYPGSFISELIEHIPVCKPCPIFQYSSLNDSVRCQVCPSDKIVTDNATACVSCDGPRVASRGVCQECPVNFVPQDNVCVPCGAGTARGKNEPQCVACSANHVSAAGQDCVRCSNGFYSLNNTCEHCGNLTTRVGDQLSCARCSDGYVLQGVLCKPCGWQQYNPADTNKCEHCDFPNEAAAATKCLKEPDASHEKTAIQITDDVSMMATVVSLSLIHI